MLELNPTSQKNVYSVPFLADTLDSFVLWFFTGSRCNLSCHHCYVESSPTANRYPYLRYATFKRALNNTLSRNYSRLEIYFTGGEPFINPEIDSMLAESLLHADTTVLTNATRIAKRRAAQLRKIQDAGKFTLTFRVSFDGPDERSNDLIRGKNSYIKANGGLKNLVEVGFNPIITAMRSWSSEELEQVKADFQTMLEKSGIPPAKQRLKILPPLRIGREADRSRPYSQHELFTKECFVDYDYSNLQCSTCRMVTEKGVWVCPILVNEEGARMGDTLDEAATAFPMRYMACWTCRMEGMNCTNS
ncbi:MAG: radical SAM protein [Candidatus Thorarchaeota archaeon]